MNACGHQNDGDYRHYQIYQIYQIRQDVKVIKLTWNWLYAANALRDQKRSWGFSEHRILPVEQAGCDMAKEILTTSDTAQLLGISVRTAQMMIEGGVLPSWKTPGGHRRVYRDDVLALIGKSGRKGARASHVHDLPRTQPESAIAIPQKLPFPVAPNENQRLAALQRSGIVDSAPEEVFDRLTWLAGQTLNAPFSLFTTLTSDRQWFKSKHGLRITETPRDWAFCNYTILQRGVFSVENLALDERFADNPAVKQDPRFCFYAGAPVVDADGFALGSLCILDRKSRTLNENEAEVLRSLAYLTSEAVQSRSAKWRLREI